MSFNKMSRDDLYNLAIENFAVDVTEVATKVQIIAALAENGVTWDMAKTFDKNAAAVEEESVTPVGVITAASTNPAVAEVTEIPILVVEKPVAPVQPEIVLIKMERANPTYQIRGYKFTRENPFALVRTHDADYILGHEHGFKMASPKEAQEYYS